MRTTFTLLIHHQQHQHQHHLLFFCLRPTRLHNDNLLRCSHASYAYAPEQQRSEKHLSSSFHGRDYWPLPPSKYCWPLSPSAQHSPNQPGATQSAGFGCPGLQNHWRGLQLRTILFSDALSEQFRRGGHWRGLTSEEKSGF